jgi:hypothetical protein
MRNMSEAVPWVDAVVAACAEIGLWAELEVYIEGDEGDYGWEAHWIEPARHNGSHWEAFHRALILCDALRPEWIPPSRVLARLLSGQDTL